MKVLALVVLVIAISGLEAGVVKREVQSDLLQKLHEQFQDFAKTWQEKIPEQTQQLLSSANEQTSSLTAHLQKFWDDLVALGKQKLS